jgi:hypothetical protein
MWILKRGSLFKSRLSVLHGLLCFPIKFPGLHSVHSILSARLLGLGIGKGKAQKRYSPFSTQLNFDKRDSLERENAYNLEVFCAYRLIPQADYAMFSGIILQAEASSVFFPSRFPKFDCRQIAI